MMRLIAVIIIFFTHIYFVLSKIKFSDSELAIVGLLLMIITLKFISIYEQLELKKIIKEKDKCE